ncbi:MAG: deoxyribodipyrimidine photo-lyase [Steroidobacteraceae bacterium]
MSERGPLPVADDVDIAILWLRRDLRLADNPAFAAAAAHSAVIPVFIWDDEDEAPWSPGAASRWWLHQSLDALQVDLLARGSRLLLRRGRAASVLPALLDETGARHVYWNRCYEPGAIARDTSIKQQLRAKGINVQSHNSALLIEPWQLATQQGKPFQVFTPFWRAALSQLPPPGRATPAPVPRAPPKWPASVTLDSLGLMPARDWYKSLAQHWQPGEAGAQQRLREFVTDGAADYARQREFPSLPGSSRLSPHLHFGEISPQQIWHALRSTADSRGLGPAHWRDSRFVTELGWREFAHHLLYHFPHTTSQPLRASFANFPWRSDEAALAAWRRGETGIPLVDAGMRELWATGWMHNRVRMVVASFLVKNLRLDWLCGARWFWDTLVDADLANNTLGWQWVAGCGADAAPYFRIFNPLSQAQKFDPGGDYVRRWVPQLGPGGKATDYPAPIVDLRVSRLDALAAYRDMRERSAGGLPTAAATATTTTARRSAAAAAGTRARRTRRGRNRTGQ